MRIRETRHRKECQIMKITLEQLRPLTRGAVRITEEDGYFRFYRFSEAQQAVYNENVRGVAASAIRLEFETDAASFVLSGSIRSGSSREFYYFDIFVNGVFCRHEGSESYQEHPDFSFEVPLTEGKISRVAVYFPCLSAVLISSLEFHGGKILLPVWKKRRMTCFGDSITQGYDARYPSLAYPNQLADAWSAEIFNKAIGGDIFRPALAAAEDPVKPDLITVAYGTNDWSHCSREEFQHNGTEFFRILTEKHPGVPVYVLLPIWRVNCETRQTAVGSFMEMHDAIREFCEPYPQITVVNGWPLVPHLEACYSPDGVHPNDFGFQFMARNLLRAIKLK